MLILRNPVNPVYNNHLIKCQIPYPAAPTNNINNNARPIITSLNFRYRLLSGGAREFCGKYGGGV
jgi:hypothetical protein